MRSGAISAGAGKRVVLNWRRCLGALLLLLGLVLSLVPVIHAQGSGSQVYIVPMQGEIGVDAAPYLARVLRQAEREQARAVVLELDTPGGRLDAVLPMRDALLASPVRTIAFVNRTAFSGGALLALAADELYVAPGAAIGAATPVTADGQAADEKVRAAVRSTFRATAEARGRDPRLAEAMVDPAVEIDGLVGGGQLLSLTANEAVARGYARGVVADRPALLQAAGLTDAAVQETAPALAERAVRVVTHPVVAALLIAAGILLIITDLLAGGVGLASAAGVALLALFFWGHMLAGLAGWEGVLLVLLGLGLLAVEVFVLPGFGVTGLFGLVALAAGLFLSVLGGAIVSGADLLRAGATVAGALLVTLAGGVLLLWLLPRTTRFAGLVLSTQLADTGGHSAALRAHAPAVGGAVTAKARLAHVVPGSLVGARGVAVTPLRPGGVADVHEQRIDVVTDGSYIAPGEPIEVIADEGYRRVVRRLTPTEGESAADQARRAS